MVKKTRQRGQLVQATAETLRQRVFANEPGAQIGSLRELAEVFNVGIVTIQQVARILEHEGLLEVRRGPGGGYFGRRPDIDTLESILAAYMRSQPASWEEALDMTSLLFNELCAAAASVDIPGELREEMLALGREIDDCDPQSELSLFEEKFQNMLFRMVNRPLFELLTRVTLHFSLSNPPEVSAQGLISPELWRAGRQRIIAAILAGDVPLARFEADRSNRQIIMRSMGQAAAV
ncbi:FadR/GntR family transcriptional regulator [Sphingorhabdus sp. M41]|uniref:FadR/GntR family transcriptional regulator n=1 Tax=Sphingorhabdus sp. M41 TaxID=1806885 RepID=UPI00078E1BB4|nr:GntR family transcriptional regulator [Sphingorhabdus sp. M41]AMO71307.1 transcriptional regulator [Sphingorhabdus sp. M41]